MRQTSLIPIRLLPGLLIGLLCFLQTSLLRAEDTVYLRTDQPDISEFKVVGEIQDYSGKALTIQTSTGNTRTFPGDQVLRLESTWTTQQQEADKAFAVGDFRTALQKYSQALSADNRIWARRMILAQIVWCYRNLDDYATAGDRFLALVASDPDTPFFAAIPLQWAPGETVTAQQSTSWLAMRDQPIARLLGASHSLSGGQTQLAVETLRELARDKDPRIAALATGQLWRSLIFSAEVADVRRWQEMASEMPVDLQAGPYFVVGTALARLGQSEEAALALLRPPILYAHQRDLAAESLLSAAGELAKMNQTKEAARLYREVISTYDGTKAKAAAQSRLNKLPQ